MLNVLSPHLREALGPLHPDWFEVLSAKASAGLSAEVHGSPGPSDVQEHCFKTPVGRVSMDSQIFSTPKIFRDQGGESPGQLTQDEELHHFERGTGESKMLDHQDSPFLFGSTKDGDDLSNYQKNHLPGNCFGFMDTPRSSISKSLRCISESLGAQIDPDMSWTSSLNTPPVLSPTIILTKTNDKFCPVTCSSEKEAIFVRKLFPSLSETSGIPKLSSDKEKPLQYSAVSQLEKVEFSETTSPDVTPSMWKQKMPDAITDRDGAEDVLSVFFNNGTHSSLWKAKASERPKRMQDSSQEGIPNSPRKGNVTSPTNITVEEPVKMMSDEVQLISGWSNDDRSAENGRKAASSGITPWTPLTLPDTAAAHSSEANCSLPSSEENTDHPTNRSVEKHLFACALESLTVCTESEVMDRVVPDHRGNAQNMQEQSKLQSPQSHSTGGEEPKSGQLNSSPTDILLLSVPVPELNHSCQPAEDTVGKISLGKLSQRTIKGQKDIQFSQPGGSELLEGSREGSGVVMSIRKPPRKFVYNQNSRLSGQTSHSTTVNKNSFTASAVISFSGDSTSRMQSKSSVFCDDEEKYEDTSVDMLDCENICTQHNGKLQENSIPMDSEKENAVCDIYNVSTAFENPSPDANSSRACSSETDNVQSGSTRPLTSTTLKGKNLSAEAALSITELNIEKEMTANQHSAFTRPDLCQSRSVVFKESTRAVNLSEYNDSLSGTVKMTNGSRQLDSGYRTSLSNVAQVSKSSDDICSPGKGNKQYGFKTASEKIISLSGEAIERAKALLDDTADSNMKEEVAHSRNFALNSNTTQQSKDLGMEINPRIPQGVNVNTGICHPSKSSVGNPSQRAPNYSFHLTGQSSSDSLTGSKTASKAVGQVSSKNVIRAKQLIEEKHCKTSPPVTAVADSGRVGHVPEMSVEAVPTPMFPASSSAHGHLDDYCSLTASQRADVTELCSLLEEADSQFEFTQLQKTKMAFNRRSEDHLQCNSDREMDADLLKGIDFDDSFTFLCEQQVKRQQTEEITSPNELLPNSDIKKNKHDSNFKSKTVIMLACESTSLTDKPTEESSFANQQVANNFLVQDNISNCENFGGFYSARGVKMTVSEESLKKASSIFSDLDCGLSSVSGNFHSSEDKCGGLQDGILKCLRGDLLSRETPCSQSEQDNQNTKELSGKELSITSVFDKGDQYLESVETCGNFNKVTSNSSGIAQHFMGFKTAKGTAVSISERTLSRVTAMFADLEEDYKNGNMEYKNKLHIDSDRKDAEMKNQCSQEMHDVNSKIKSTLNAESTKGYSNTLTEESVSKELCLEVNVTAGKLLDAVALQNKIISKRDCFMKNSHNLPGGFESIHAGSKQSEEGLQYVTSYLKKPVENAIECENSTGDYQSDLSLGLQSEKGGGFKTASGKGVAISAKALQQAKTVFRECGDTTSCETITSVEEKVSSNEIIPGGSFGFTFASGKGVSISKKSLQQANVIFKDCDKATTLEMIKAVEKSSSGSKTISEGRHEFSLATGKEKAFFKDCNDISSSETGAEMKKPAGNDHSVCSTPGMSHFGALSTIGEKEVCVPEMALVTQPDAECLKEHDKHLAGKPTVLGLMHERSYGFNTASGKGVHVSTKALQKAKVLFADMENASFYESGTQDTKRDGKSSSTGSFKCAEKSNYGFSTASGKKVTVSEKALKKAKSLLDQPEESDQTKPEKYVGTFKCTKDNVKEFQYQNNIVSSKGSSTSLKTQDNAEVIEVQDKFEKNVTLQCGSTLNDSRMLQCGFSTAGGKGVVISGKALKEAKALFEDCDNLDVPCAKVNRVTTKTRSLYAAHHNSWEGACSVRESEMVSANSCQKGTALRCDRIEQVNGPIKKVSNNKLIEEQAGPQRKLQESLSSPEAPQEDSSLLNLGISGCTVTQQKYLEQEAMACTRALLEDEEFTRMVSHHPRETNLVSQYPDLPEMRVQSVKRFRTMDFDQKDQPPLKRQLLTEFDRTSNGGKYCQLTPLKSSPKGILNDRRIFTYRMPLQLNVTRPSVNKSSEDQRFQQKSDSSQLNSSRMKPSCTVFLPPFQKQPAAEAEGGIGSQESKRPTGVFVPPFRNTHFKMNSGLKDNAAQVLNRRQSPCKSQVAVEPCVFVPPTKKKPDINPEAPNVGELEITYDKGKGGLDWGAINPAPALTDEEKAHRSETRLMAFANLQNARDLQAMRILKKKRQIVRPQPGSLLLAKTSGGPRKSLKNVFRGRPPSQHTQEELYKHGVHQIVSQITSNNAESFRFHFSDFFSQEVFTEGCGIQLADGGWLIPTNEGTLGKEEFHRAFCDTPGVDPKLISESWVYNHYRWVVWKLASMEKSFPEQMGSQCLTPEQVLLQLKYRYDVEIDQSQRSALRKIMERDDTPAKTLVLCVCDIACPGSTLTLPGQPENKHIKDADAKNDLVPRVVWVTDGWYSIKALLDAPLTTMVQKGRLTVGMKIVTHGAELVGSQDACTPLEAPSTLMLKISINSTRRARWDAKLGFHRDPRPFRLPLSSLYSNGGLVGCVDIVVLRSYPVQWMEKVPSGAFVFRNGRAEDREAHRHSDNKQRAMEALFNKVQVQFEKDQEVKSKLRGRKQTFTHQEIEALQDGEELHEAVDSDPTCMEALLSEKQLEILRSYRQSLEKERQACLQEQFRQALEEAQKAEVGCSDREVTPVWKLRISDCQEKSNGRGYFLNIWRPSADLQTLLKEGSCYRVYNLATSEGKKRASNIPVQLTTTKKTQFQHIQRPPEALSELFQSRVSVNFQTLLDPGFRPLCNEVDVVGFVICITDTQGSIPVVYLADKCSDLVAVRFSCSLAQLALEEVVRPQALLAFSNLQLGNDAYAPMPVLFAGDLAFISANPKEPHLQDACVQMRKAVQGNEFCFATAEEKLFNIILSDGCCLPSPKVKSVSPETSNWGTRQPTKNIDAVPTPLKPVTSCTPLSRKPPTLATTSEDRDSKRLKRKLGLDYLSRIPSPPPLQPLGTSVSPFVSRTFQPPRRSETPSSAGRQQKPVPHHVLPLVEDEWVNDDELAMINTQALPDGLVLPNKTGGSQGAVAINK